MDATAAMVETGEQVLANARLVLRDEVVTGSVLIAGGRIRAIDSGSSVPAGATDCEGAYVLPGLVELHTDNLERHLRPRPGVAWPADAAVIAHDAELAAVGITTVFDALRIGALSVGGESSDGGRSRHTPEAAAAVTRLDAQGALRISHALHVRAEVCAETVLDELDALAGNSLVRIVSLMDHTPGQRQWADEELYRQFHKVRDGWSDEHTDRVIARAKALRQERGAEQEHAVAARARQMGAVLASHDDTTEAQVAHSAAIGVRLAEFPTTGEAARACSAANIPVMMGAPNLVRGGSHSGNVAASELADAGCLDVLSSDYAPSSLLLGAMMLGRSTGNMARALATVTATPARVAGFNDRGVIAEGMRADLLRVAEIGHLPVLRDVLVAGHKVA